MPARRVKTPRRLHPLTFSLSHTRFEGQSPAGGRGNAPQSRIPLSPPNVSHGGAPRGRDCFAATSAAADETTRRCPNRQVYGPTMTSFGAEGRWKSIPRDWLARTVSGKLRAESSILRFQVPWV